jgi:predicted DNA-binding transcriptional regulator AlpA
VNERSLKELKMNVPAEQSAEHYHLHQKSKRSASESRQPSASSKISPHQRQGDRGSDDDTAARLPTFVRFHDLRAVGIVSNWPQLYNLIDDYDFPPGVLLSPNIRAWDIEEVQRWLASRPTDRKIVAPRRSKQTEPA